VFDQLFIFKKPNTCSFMVYPFCLLIY